MVSGNLVVASTSYTTAGNLHGFGYTWSNFSSSATSKPCIAPTCTGTTCTPRFSSPTAVCAAGTVEADSTYLSLVGLGMNLNQTDAGGTPDSVPAPASITVTTVLDSATLGYARIQLISGSSGSDAAVTTYCVEAGQWKSGTPIPITKFNTKCWLPTGNGTALTVGTGLTAIYILIPCDGVDARPFSMCLTGITFTP